MKTFFFYRRLLYFETGYKLTAEEEATFILAADTVYLECDVSIVGIQSRIDDDKTGCLCRLVLSRKSMRLHVAPN
jgi:hypothetical protein